MGKIDIYLKRKWCFNYRSYLTQIRHRNLCDNLNFKVLIKRIYVKQNETKTKKNGPLESKNLNGNLKEEKWKLKSIIIKKMEKWNEWERIRQIR